jgi:small subunit ribosomal protein S15
MSKKQKHINKAAVISSHKQSDIDTGSPEVQIALLTARINNLVAHLNSHKGDKASRTGLLRLVGQRRRLYQYLERSKGEEMVKKLKAELEKNS